MKRREDSKSGGEGSDEEEDEESGSSSSTDRSADSAAKKQANGVPNGGEHAAATGGHLRMIPHSSGVNSPMAISDEEQNSWEDSISESEGTDNDSYD